MSMGEALIDLIHTEDGSDPVPLIGGSPYNVAIAMARLGLDVGFICPISSDAFGQRLAQGLIDEGVQQCISERAEAPSAVAEVFTDTSGHPRYVFHRERTADRALGMHPPIQALPAQVEALHFGSLVLAQAKDWPAWRTAIVEARSRGAFIAFDPNVRPALIDDLDAYRERVEDAVELADLVKASDEDLLHLWPRQTPEERIQQWLSPHRTVVLTKGGDGCQLWAHPDTVAVYRAAAHVNIVDTVGAGDTFQAALIAGFLQRASPSSALGVQEATELLDFASTAALINCSRAGCQPPTGKEIEWHQDKHAPQ